MIDNLQKTVIILGMHRSGTSMIGGILKCLEVDLGEDHPGKQWSNPLGHFEDIEFIQLNTAILEAAGGSWDNPPKSQTINNQVDKFRKQIIDLITAKKEINRNKLWGWKDPRTSLTIELYLPYLDSAYFIWCQRDPEAIAESLWHRNRISHSSGLSLVNIYQQRIADFFKMNPALPFISLCYQDVIKEPEVWVKKIAEFLNLNPANEQFERAVELVLPREKVIYKKIIWLINYLISLPSRALKRYVRKR